MTKSVRIENDIKDHNLNDEVMLKGLHSNNDEDDEFKALGKIRLEDLQLQECVLKLESKIRELAKENNKFIFQAYDKDLESDDNSQNVELTEPIVGKGLEVKESIMQKLLDFLQELYLEIDDVNIYSVELLKSKKKQKFIESIITFLKKFLLQGHTLSIKQSLEQQIKELELALSEESDPALHKLLQVRLMLLRQIYMMGLKTGLDANTFLKFLLISSVSNTILKTDSLSVDDNKGSYKRYATNLYDSIRYKDEVNHTEDKSYDYSISSINIISNDIPGIYLGKVNTVSYNMCDYYSLDRSPHINTLQLQEVAIRTFIEKILDFIMIKLQAVVNTASNNIQLQCGDGFNRVNITNDYGTKLINNNDIYNRGMLFYAMHYNHATQTNYGSSLSSTSMSYSVNYTTVNNMHVHGGKCCSLLEEVKVNCVQSQLSQQM
ncbi:hypothetical protein [Candidatus Neoehrlichia procyonis]|uniref:Uncharacterized protein n=1 Tax=Candidatus Neoehrlichia procyonis str. RAC413 TaxID=1359163 RepID=A0A0F3NLP2_9RICK|nr:hypothetical protein [Candidatus Neoehrlichia lotoris]KJV68988.1 hypothetical protein NLO413_0361 [Candidatus Neoehrlichia lotoris str. RAC413]